MNNLWESATVTFADVYQRSHLGCHLRPVLEDMEFHTELVESCVEKATHDPHGACGPCMAAGKALLELTEPNRYYAVQHYHFPNSTLSWDEWQALDCVAKQICHCESQDLPACRTCPKGRK